MKPKPNTQPLVVIVPEILRNFEPWRKWMRDVRDECPDCDKGLLDCTCEPAEEVRTEWYPR